MEPLHFRHAANMPTIYGREHHEVCQDMLEAGVNWLHLPENAEKAKNLTGQLLGPFNHFEPVSDGAKELYAVIRRAVPEEKSFGMLRTEVMRRLFYIAVHGWNAYCFETSKDFR